MSQRLRTRLNSVDERFKECNLPYLCKSMACSRCIDIRRTFFIENSGLYALSKGLDSHVVICWGIYCFEDRKSWSDLASISKELQKNISSKIGPFVRTLGVGNIHGGHSHFLVKDSSIDLLENQARKMALHIFVEPVYNIFELLGYFFDRNYLIVQNHKKKPARTRILSGSREGGSYGFPSTKDFKALEDKRKKLEKVSLELYRCTKGL